MAKSIKNPMNVLLEEKPISATSSKSSELTQLIRQYGCGPVQFTGTSDALYDRHLVFDNVMKAAAIGDRERFEALAHSVRDVLSQRWIRTEETYDRNDPKRVYYLSMEFLIGRSLANMVWQGDLKCRWLRKIFQRPNDCRICSGDLGCKTLPRFLVAIGGEY
jgi:hypothetical protein